MVCMCVGLSVMYLLHSLYFEHVNRVLIVQLPLIYNSLGFQKYQKYCVLYMHLCATAAFSIIKMPPFSIIKPSEWKIFLFLCTLFNALQLNQAVNEYTKYFYTVKQSHEGKLDLFCHIGAIHLSQQVVFILFLMAICHFKDFLKIKQVLSVADSDKVFQCVQLDFLECFLFICVYSAPRHLLLLGAI